MLGEVARLLRGLSLDVAAGAACGAALAAATTGAALPWPVWILLPSAVWLVYTIDHLLDGHRLGERAQSFRHRLHARHARSLALAASALAAAGAGLAVVTLPAAVLVAGIVVGAGAGAHLVAAQGSAISRVVPKEVSAAAVYTAGVWCAPLALAPALPVWTWPALALFFIAALANLLLNAQIERPADEADGAASWARTFGEAATARAIDGLALTAVGVASLAAAAARLRLHGVFVVLLVLGVLPAVLLRLRRHLEPRERYRAVGDIAFLLAAIPAVLR